MFCFCPQNICRGTISATGLVDRLLGRLSAYFRGEFIEDINDHATSEYVRLFEQIVMNSRVPLLEKAASVVVDALHGVAEKVHTIFTGVTTSRRALKYSKEINSHYLK